MRSSKIFKKRGLLLDKDIVDGGSETGAWLSCNCILDVAKEKDFNQKLKRFPKLSKLGDIVSKLA